MFADLYQIVIFTRVEAVVSNSLLIAVRLIVLFGVENLLALGDKALKKFTCFFHFRFCEFKNGIADKVTQMMIRNSDC